jgi:prevent-host-death family protein
LTQEREEAVSRKNATSITIPSTLARIQTGSLLNQIADRSARFVITRSGKPAAVLLGVDDFDDLVEKLDPVFQKSLMVAAAEYNAGQAIALGDLPQERKR